MNLPLQNTRRLYSRSTDRRTRTAQMKCIGLVRKGAQIRVRVLVLAMLALMFSLNAVAAGGSEAELNSVLPIDSQSKDLNNSDPNNTSVSESGSSQDPLSGEKLPEKKTPKLVGKTFESIAKVSDALFHRSKATSEPDAQTNLVSAESAENGKLSTPEKDNATKSGSKTKKSPAPLDYETFTVDESVQWQAKEDCQCVPSTNILQRITYGVINAGAEEQDDSQDDVQEGEDHNDEGHNDDEPNDDEQESLAIDFGKLVRAGYFLPSDWHTQLNPLSKSYQQFSEIAHQYNTQVDIIVPYKSLLLQTGKANAARAECASQSAINDLSTQLAGSADGINLFIEHNRFKTTQAANCSVAKVIKQIATATQQQNPAFKVNLMIPEIFLHKLRHQVEHEDLLLRESIEQYVDYILVMEKAASEKPPGSHHPEDPHHALLNTIIGEDLPPSIYKKIIPLLTNKDLLAPAEGDADSSWQEVTQLAKGYGTRGLGLMMGAQALSDLSVIELQRDLSEMDDIKRFQFRVCPECCNLICPHQSTIRTTLFAVTAGGVLLLILCQFSITTTVWLNGMSWSVLLSSSALFTVFEGLMVCDPWFQDSRDFSALISLLLIIVYIAFSSYQRRRAREYP